MAAGRGAWVMQLREGNLGSIGLSQFESRPDSSGRSLWLHEAMAAAALPAALPVRLLRAAQTWHPLAQRTRLPRCSR